MINHKYGFIAECDTSGADRTVNMILAIDRYGGFKSKWLKKWLEDEFRMTIDPIMEDIDMLLEQAKPYLSDDTYYYVKGLILYGPLKADNEDAA